MTTSAASPPGAPSPDGLAPGARFGKYEIIRRLARGGMAEIYLADVRGNLPGVRQMVVLKRILPNRARQSDFVDMFLNEARLAANLHHPNVVQVFDVGVEDGTYYIAMEYLRGEDVRSIVRAAPEHKLPIEHALNIIVGVCSGLHYAHEKGGFDGRALCIVHRDVSPQNVVVTFDGAVKLLDFGIAKATNQISETRVGQLKGKAPYMSPEQCLGHDLDRRSDIFSLGILLYELTVGRRLYAGKNDFDVMRDIVDGRITPPREIDPLYHPTLETIVMRALHKDRDQRFATARDLQHDIEELLKKSHLYISPTGLSDYMSGLFGSRVEVRSQARLDHLEPLLVGPLSHGSPVPPPAHLGGEPLHDAPRMDASALRDRLETPFELPAMKLPQASSAPPPSVGPPHPHGSHGPAVPSVTIAFDELRTPTARSRLLTVPPGRALASRRPPLPPILAPVAVPTAVQRAPRMRWGLALCVIGTTALVPALIASHRRQPPPSIEPATRPAPPVSAGSPGSSALPESKSEPSPVAVDYGIVKVETFPPGATLYLDGTRLDRTSPATFDRLEARREHVLLVQLAAHADVVERFTLQPSDVLPLTISLKPSSRRVHVRAKLTPSIKP